MIASDQKAITWEAAEFERLEQRNFLQSLVVAHYSLLPNSTIKELSEAAVVSTDHDLKWGTDLY